MHPHRKDDTMPLASFAFSLKREEKSAFLLSTKKMNTSTYELVLLISPELSESQAEEHIASFQKNALESRGASVSSVDFWGRKRLAYPINKEEFASYVVLYIDLPTNKVSELDEEMRLDKKIIRHLLSLEDKHNVRMTLEEMTAWNVENLPEKPKSRKPEEKRAPLKKRAPRRGPADNEIVPATPVKKEAKKMDKAKLNKELDAILDE